jgi:hypothetical protein
MGVSKTDLNNICVKVYGEKVANNLFNSLAAPKIVEMVIVEDWDKNILNTAERTAIRLVWKGLQVAGAFHFDPDDIKRNCNNCANVTKDGKDCSVFSSQGTCHLSIPNLWVAKTS